MRRGLFLILLMAIPGPALAVDLTNNDATSHAVVVCDSNCEPVDNPDGTFRLAGELLFNIAPGQTVTGLCANPCVILTEEEGITMEDLAFSDEFSGSQRAVIRGGYVYPAD
jgi:hypothetical protein